MRRTMILAMAAGVTLSAAIPAQLLAQGRSQAAQERRTQSQTERERERERLRAERNGETEQRQRELNRQQEQREVQNREELRRRELERERQARIHAAELRRLEVEREARARAAAEQRRRELERLRNSRDGYDYDDRYDQRNDRYGYNDRFPDHRNYKQGPAFCRSGAGHPVHGRQWCAQKGYGVGWDRWERSRYDDVIFRDRDYDRYQRVNRSVLGDILGSVVLGRFESYGRRYGSGSVSGSWLPQMGANILQLSIGNVPFARLVDVNRDGRVDDVFVIN